MGGLFVISRRIYKFSWGRRGKEADLLGSAGILTNHLILSLYSFQSSHLTLSSAHLSWSSHLGHRWSRSSLGRYPTSFSGIWSIISDLDLFSCTSMSRGCVLLCSSMESLGLWAQQLFLLRILIDFTLNPWNICPRFQVLELIDYSFRFFWKILFWPHELMSSAAIDREIIVITGRDGRWAFPFFGLLKS